MIELLPGTVAGRLRAPASKSHLQRLLLAACQAPGRSLIREPGHSEDGVACLGVIRDLGARVEEAGGSLAIHGGGSPVSGTLDCGESGFCLRAAAAVASLEDRPMTLSGRGSLLTRPMEMVLEPLRQLGVVCSTREGFPPISLRGPLQGGFARVDGRSSSQFLSGLLLALPRAPGDSLLEVEGLRSGPYIRMTLDVLEAFGVRVEASPSLDRFSIPGGQRFRPAELAVEGDWSGAAFLLVAGALAGEVAVEGLNPVSAQADRAVLEALEAAGAAPRWTGGDLGVARAELSGFTFDATDCPDLFPPLVALACGAKGLTRLRGVSRLKVKECDRAAALVAEFSALGARVAVQGDWMEIHGGPLRGGRVDPHNDHRIAMACAVAGLVSGGPVSMEGETCVDKSYPDFFRDLAFLRGGA